MKNNYQCNFNGVRMGGGSIEHPLSIHSASIGTRWKPRGMQLICTLVLLFTFAIGQMWGADTELVNYNFKSWTAGSISAGSTVNGVYFKSGVTVSSDKGITVSGNASTSSNYLAIPLSNVNGSITIEVTHESKRPQWKHAVVGYDALPASISNPSSVADNTRPSSNTTTSSWSVDVAKSYAILYIGKGSNGVSDIYGIRVTTPAAATCEDAPTVSSMTKGATTATTQVVNCAGISSLGSEGCTISSYGFVYGTSANPTISDTKVQVGTTYTTTGTAFATTTLTGLTPNTTYYVRAYATNGAGTAYSSGDSFTTPASIGNVVYIAGSADASNDAIKALRDANYVVTVRTKAGSPNYEGVDLVVLDESLSWNSSSDEVGTIKAADVPILNLKAFFYTTGSSARWNWGTPVNPSSSSELATLSTEYSNVSSHPIFDGVTISAGAIDMIGTSKSGNNLQGVTTNTLVSGKEGYTLATSASGTTCIHELTPAQRGVTNSKYLLIALSNNVKDNYSADAKKMIVNAAAYLIDNTQQWAPAAPTGYSVTYEENGHGAAQTDLTGQTALPNPLPELSESGWTFGGWFTDNGTFETAAVAGATLTANATLYAKWTEAAPAAVCPSGLTISGTNAYTEGETIELTAALTAGNGEISYQWYKGSVAAGNEVGTNSNELTIASCATTDAGDYFCVASKDGCDDVQSTAYAVTVAAAPTPCYSFTAPTDQTVTFHKDDAITGSTGGSIVVYSEAFDNNSNPKNGIAFDSNGLKLGGGGNDRIQITLNNLMQVGSVISISLTSGTGSSNPRGLYLKNESNSNVKDGNNQNVLFGWATTPETPEQETFTYTVRANDGLEGKNVFILQRQNTVWIRSMSVSNCGAELHALTSAVSVEGKATVTLSKSLIAEGGTATATYSDIDAAYEFDEWVINGTGASLSSNSANPTTITMGSTDAVVTLKLKAAPVKRTVTYYDGSTKLGEEEINEGGNPTGAGLAPHKLGYTFGGWSLTNNGDAITSYASVTVNADMPLYAVWNEVNCATKTGTIYTMEIAVAPTANCTIKTASGFEPTLDLYQYEGIVGGEAMLGNTGSSNNCILQTNKTILLKDNVSYLKLDFDCPLKEGDKIQSNVTGSGKAAYISVADSRPDESGALAILANSTTGEITVPAALNNAQTIYIWKGGGNVTITSISIVRPAKYDVTFNMHGHGDAPAAQSITDGGKVTKPSDPSASGWDFAGWYKTYVADPESYSNPWDFANDVVSAATELHAKWTEHVYSSDATLSSLTVNGEAITLEDGVFGYAFELPMGTTALPAIVAVANDPNSKGVSVVQTNIGSATITVTAEDNSTIKNYTITFTVATSKDIELVWDKTKKRCDDTTPTANVKSDDASVSAYINKITFTGGGEGTSLNVGNTTGNMFTLSAKAGYAFQAMSFFGKIQDATCEYSLDGGAWTELASTKTDGDKCYANIFSAAEVHEFRLRSTGTSGVWIRNMQLTIVEACTPIVLAWDEEPVEFEVGKSGYAIAATANNGGTVSYSTTASEVVDVVAATGALTISGLGSATLKAATAEGDGTTYCANGGNNIEISKAVNTYYLVKFDAQNGDAATEVKYFSGDDAIALPAAPIYPGYDFQGWFDAETGGNQYTAAIAPAASMTVYAQWQAQCDGATITTQPTGANYITGRIPANLVCEATAGNGGALTYEWFTCDDALKTNPVAATATPSTAVAGTFYYFCKVTEEGCAVEAFSNVVTITVADKDAICIIKSTPTSGTEATVEGVYQGNAYFEGRAADKKLNSQYHYVGVELASGNTFLATDKVVLNQVAAVSGSDLSKFYVFTEVPANGKAYATVLNASPVQGNNWFAMPTENVGQTTLYVGRVDANCNPSVGYLAVYRACAPILSKITVNSVEGTPDNTNHVTIEVPASTTQTQLEAIAYEWVSNSDAWTAAHDPAAANAWEFGVENTVTFTDKDGDASEYYITVNKAAASSDATLSALTVNGQAISLEDGVFEYSFELPYGTTTAPTVVATANHTGAVATVDPCTLSGATITVVPESGAGDQQIYTLTFTVAAWEEIVIWDGSYMTAVVTSPTAETELRWATTDFGSIGSYTTTYGEKSYSKYLPSGGASTGRYMTLTVPAGYVAKFYIVMATHSDTKERGMFIGSNLVKDPDATSVLELSNNDRDVAVAGMSEIVGAGTWYINPNNSIDFQEIRAYLRPGYKRNAMLGAGVYGTICVDHNVAIEDIHGISVYELQGRENTYGKLVFDEIISGEMEAGVPYVFQAEGDEFLLYYGGTKVGAPVDKHNGMYGTFEQIVLTELNDIYYFAQRALWSCDGAIDLTIPANRAYVKLSEIDYLEPNNQPAPGRRRVTMAVNGEKVVTDIDNLFESEQPVKVMIDGQLFIIRGEKMFDATGRLVK